MGQFFSETWAPFLFLSRECPGVLSCPFPCCLCAPEVSKAAQLSFIHRDDHCDFRMETLEGKVLLSDLVTT